MATTKRPKSKLSKNEVAANFARDWVEFTNPEILRKSLSVI